MNTTNITLPALIKSGLGVVTNIEQDREMMHRMTAWLAQQGRVSVIDCGCAFNASRVMELLHLQHVFFRDGMERIDVARAFTVYQLMTLLEHRPASAASTLIINPLHLFYDDNIRTPEAMRLFSIGMHHLSRLSRFAPVILNGRPPTAEFEDRSPMLAILRKQADQLIEPGVAEDVVRQLTLI
ncbi:MAG: hypothetical protein AAF633_03805 [Chloroflexota bacterium]